MKTALDATAITCQPSGARTRMLGLYTCMAAREGVELTVFLRRGAGLTAPFRKAGAVVEAVKGMDRTWLRAWQGCHPAARRSDDPRRFQLFAAETLPLPAMGRVPQVATLHDLRFLQPGLSTFPRRFFGKFLLHGNLLRARAVITVSHAMKNELQAAMGKKSLPTVHVVPNGIPDLPALEEEEARARLASLGVEEPFILYLGHLEARKNLERLVHAFFRFRKSHEKAAAMSLVLAGRAKKHHDARLLASVAAGSTDAGSPMNHMPDGAGSPMIHLPCEAGSPMILLPGEVDEETRAALLRRACMAIQPSCYEGFNLGLLEAMAAGLPTACSRIPAHQEVGGDGVSYFAPESTGDMAQALTETAFHEERRKALADKGRKRAAPFTWDGSAGQLEAIWRTHLIK